MARVRSAGLRPASRPQAAKRAPRPVPTALVMGAPVFRPARAAPRRSARRDADLRGGGLLSVHHGERRHDIRGPSARGAGLKTGGPGCRRSAPGRIDRSFDHGPGSERRPPAGIAAAGRETRAVAGSHGVVMGAPVFRPARAAPQRSARRDADLRGGGLLSVHHGERRHDISGPSARGAGLKTGGPGCRRSAPRRIDRSFDHGPGSERRPPAGIAAAGRETRAAADSHGVVLGAPVFRPARAAPRRSARRDADLRGGGLLSVHHGEQRHDIRGLSAQRSEAD